ncbi:MAG: hypothetical protein P8H31_05705 [Porticoccaceae bacterium]|nr:hypothetical protein [Porticoccaceae bacterium]
MKIFMIVGVFSLALLAASCGKQKTQNAYDFIVLADTAYVIPDDNIAYDALINRINEEASSFAIHLGDVLGLADCGDETLQRVKGDFGKFEKPLIYTPGDNEWTDCHKKLNGEYDPVERLKALRHIFFSAGISFGREKLTLHQQAGAETVENSLWQKGEVLYATVHIVGSNNGLKENSFQDKNSEFYMRNEANKKWLRKVFRQAAESGVQALVLACHANIFIPSGTQDGFADMRTMIGQLGDEFDKPVLLVHGDHHQFLIDRPYSKKPGRSFGANITRLQTFGWPDAKAVKIHVDTSTEAVFSFAPLYVGEGLYPSTISN